MFNKAKNCLKNETGGPNLETLISIGFAMCVLTAVLKLGRTLWSKLHDMPNTNVVTGNPKHGKIIQGYTLK